MNIFVIIYLNNILIYSKNEADYKVYIKKILKVLKKVDLRIKFKKSQFYQTEIKFLSYIIIEDRIEINLEKVRVIIK